MTDDPRERTTQESPVLTADQARWAVARSTLYALLNEAAIKARTLGHFLIRASTTLENLRDEVKEMEIK